MYFNSLNQHFIVVHLIAALPCRLLVRVPAVVEDLLRDRHPAPAARRVQAVEQTVKDPNESNQPFTFPIHYFYIFLLKNIYFFRAPESKSPTKDRKERDRSSEKKKPTPATSNDKTKPKGHSR